MSFIHKFVAVDHFFNIQEKQSEREREKTCIISHLPRAISHAPNPSLFLCVCEIANLDHKRKQKLFVYVLVRISDKIVYY